MEVAAVIFADGTYIGSAPDSAHRGQDAVSEIFEYRAGEAEAWNDWNNIALGLTADNQAAIDEYLKLAANTPVPDHTKNASWRDIRQDLGQWRDPGAG